MKISHIVLMSTFCISQIHAYPLPKQTIKSYECKECATLSRDRLQDKWSVSGQPLNDKISNAQKSYGYRETVTAQQLKDGMIISTLAPGAVIRITPLQKKPLPQLMIKTPTNKLFTLQEASTLLSQDETGGESALSMKHQTMLQIKPELGAGNFILKSNARDEKNSDSYLINVLDKFSYTYLQVETDSLHYKYNDKLISTITLNDNDGDYSIDDIKVSLVSPQGEVTPLKVAKIKHNIFQTTSVLNSEINDHGSNWYIEASVETNLGQNMVKRSGHTAFSHAIPSGSLLSIKKSSSTPLTFLASVDIASASRYALQAVLFHQNGENAIIKPIEISQNAQWLESGKHTIQFTFDNLNQLSEDSLYLGYLHLIDYGQLRTVYRYNKPIKVNQLLE